MNQPTSEAGLESSRARGRASHLPATVAPLIAAIVVTSALLSISELVPAPPVLCGPTLPSAMWGPSPIRHIVFLIKENHAFENYFGTYPGVDGNPPNGTIPVAYGSSSTVSPFALRSSSTPDLPHDRPSAIRAVDGGRMDNFVAQAAADGYSDPSAAVGYYTAREIPQYFAYAQNYTLSDAFFAGVLGPTVPNRLFDLAGTSDNVTADGGPPPGLLNVPTILDELSEHALPWDYDFAGSETNLTPLYFTGLAHDDCALAHIVPIQYLPAQLNGPDPPAVLYLDPSHDPTYSEHPPQNVTLGAEWTAAILNAIFSSPVAASTVVFDFYDEYGGFWDPVAPPAVDAFGDGVRIPLIVVSPWTPAHKVVHESLDPASLLRFVDTNFGLPFLNERVASAPPLEGVFNFSSPPRSPVLVPTPLQFSQVAHGSPTGPIIIDRVGGFPAATPRSDLSHREAAPMAAALAGRVKCPPQGERGLRRGLLRIRRSAGPLSSNPSTQRRVHGRASPIDASRGGPRAPHRPARAAERPRRRVVPPAARGAPAGRAR